MLLRTLGLLAMAAALRPMLSAQTPTPPPTGKAEHMSAPVTRPRIIIEKPELPQRSTPMPRRIWSAVILANNVAKPKPAPAELQPLSARLQRVFGYNQFEIVGQDGAPLEDGAERKLTPSRAFWIDLKARQASVKEARGGFLLNLRLYQDEKPLVDSVALIAPDSPLFFRGPMHAKGQVIIVLQVTP